LTGCTVESSGFSGTVAVTCSGLPIGAACDPTPDTVTVAPGESEGVVVAVSAESTTPIGDAPFAIEAAGGSLADSAALTLTVVASTATCP
jgi:hypothetical protein